MSPLREPAEGLVNGYGGVMNVAPTGCSALRCCLVGAAVRYTKVRVTGMSLAGSVFHEEVFKNRLA